MNEYFIGAVAQHLERGQRLLTRIPTNLPREFHLLAQTCRRELSGTLDGLKFLIEDPQMRLPGYQPERLRAFRRLVNQLRDLEATGIAALERQNDHDVALNRLVCSIANEIAYPLVPPAVISLSQEYFHIDLRLNLLSVPLSEGDFLLHLPDLYHELAHPLVLERYDPRAKPFQLALLDAIERALEYVRQEQAKENRRRGPRQLSYYLYQWEKSWWKWAIEFFCDLFAISTVGPAFAWSHLHLFAKYGEDPYRVPLFAPSSHPADDARMRVMLAALSRLGFQGEARSIGLRWDKLVRLSSAGAEPEYHRCYPQHLLEGIVQCGSDRIAGVGCSFASQDRRAPINSILNTAWQKFWNDPAQYLTWERDAVNRLHQFALMPASAIQAH